MNAALICVAASVFGVDVGWEPIADGSNEVEFTIQLRPQQLDTLLNQGDLAADMPSWLKVARYRITVGNAALPKIPSVEQLKAAANLEKTRERQEEVAEDLPFRKASSGREQPARAETPQPIAAIAATPARDPLLQPEPEAQPTLAPKRDLFDRGSAEPEHPLAAQNRSAAKDRDWNQPAIAPNNSERPPADPEPQTADERMRSGRGFDSRTSEKPLETTAVADNRLAAADRVEGPRLRDPLFQAKPDEFKLESPSHVIPATDEERYGTNRGSRRDDRNPQDKPPAATPAPKTPASNAKHEDEKAEPHSSGWAIAFTSVLLLASIAGNVTLGLFALGERTRSRGLLEKLRAATATSKR